MAVAKALAVPTAPDTASARGWWALVLVGGVLGVVGTVWQTVERIASLADAGHVAACDINAVISCGSVYEHWQASALGVPNSLVGLPVFAVMASAALGGLLGSRPAARYLVVLWGLALFMTGFVTWYMQQTAFVMGALCLFCTASLVTIVLVGLGLTRVVDAEGALGEGRVGAAVRGLVDSGADLLAWLALVAGVALMLYVGLLA